MTDAVIAVGQIAPDFSLPASIEPSPLRLSDLRGKVVVLAFYVLDFTNTWRTELISFQENLSRFEQLNAQVLGISVDSVDAHRAFADHLGGLTYPLLADFHPKGEVIKQYGLWRDDKGHSRRAIIIVDPEGIVRHVQVIQKGPPDVEAVLAAVQAIHSADQGG